jgi:hypothetical protein
MSKFSKLIKDLELDDKFTKTIIKEKTHNHVKDNVPLVEDYNMMADLLFVPTAAFGYKYLFVIVDLATDEFDIEPIKNKDDDTVLKAMKACFKRDYIKKPKYTLTTDAGNEFKDVFQKYLYDESIYHTVALPHRHNSTSNVEALNKQLSKLIMLYLNKKDKATGKRQANWLPFIPTLREQLNAIRKKDVPDDINSYEYPVQKDLQEIPSSKAKGKKEYVEIKPKFKVGQYVYRYLDIGKDALGKNQKDEKRRMGDINWDTKPRRIMKVNTMIGEGSLYRYRLAGLKGATFTERQLKRAPEPDDDDSD